MCKKDKEYEGFLRVPFQEYFKIFLRIVVSLAKEVVGTSHQTYIYIYCFGNILRFGALGAQVLEK